MFRRRLFWKRKLGQVSLAMAMSVQPSLIEVGEDDAHALGLGHADA